MLLVCTTWFKVMGICLTLYTTSGSASPMAIGFTPIPPAVLHRRRPDPNLCHYPGQESIWIKRWCTPSRGPWAWEDICSTRAGAGFYVPTTKPGSCFLNEVCQNTKDKDGDKVIQCLEKDAPGTQLGRAKINDPLAGSSRIESASGDDTDFTFDVPIPDNLGLCSVAATVLSKDLTWAIATIKPIIGRKNKGTIACQGDQSDSEMGRECYPLGFMNLNKGDTINFTWAMSMSQQGVLEYVIWPQTSRV